MTDSPTRILLADPHPIVRLGLTALLSDPGLSVIGEAANGPEAVRLVADLDPDLVIAEVCLPGLDGERLTPLLREVRPDRRVLAFTSCEDRETIRRVLGSGVAGYALKRADAAEVVRAVRAVAAGGTYLDPAVAGPVTEGAAGPPGAGDAPVVALSQREAEVVRLLALGYSNKEIASRFKVSVKTVETYKTRAMEKLGLKGRVDLVRYAARRGWLDDRDT